MPGLNDLRILIADDHEIVRRGLKKVLSSRQGWAVCAEAATGREAVAMAAQYRPDIVVMDISMPELNGLEATRKIRKMLPKAEDPDFIASLFRPTCARSCGRRRARLPIEIRSYAGPSTRHRSFGDSPVILYVERGRNSVDEFCNQDSGKSGTLLRHRLSSREREIVQLLAEGKSSKEVAGMLGLSTKTAETHRANLMRKLELHSVSELVRYAIRNRVIEP